MRGVADTMKLDVFIKTSTPTRTAASIGFLGAVICKLDLNLCRIDAEQSLV